MKFLTEENILKLLKMIQSANQLPLPSSPSSYSRFILLIQYILAYKLWYNFKCITRREKLLVYKIFEGSVREEISCTCYVSNEINLNIWKEKEIPFYVTFTRMNINFFENKWRNIMIWTNIPQHISGMMLCNILFLRLKEWIWCTHSNI